MNCRGSHKPNDPSCPELLKQNQIQELAAQRNIPFIEAKNIIHNLNGRLHNNPLDFHNFSELSPPPSFGSSPHYSLILPSLSLPRL